MTKTKKNAAPKFFKPVFTALLAALIVLLTFTVGSLRIGPITITFNCLPLAVGTVFLGPVYGAILGLVFGLSSFFASFTSASLTTILLSSQSDLRLAPGTALSASPQEQRAETPRQLRA